VSSLPARRTIAPRLLPSRIRHHRLTHRPATGPSKCQVLLMSPHPLVSSCPSTYATATRPSLYHPTYLLHRMLTRFNLPPCLMSTPPPAYRSRLMLRMASTRCFHMTTPLHLNQFIGLFESAFSFLFLFLSVSFILCFYISIGPIALALARYIAYCRASPLWIGDTMPLCLPLISFHELHSVHTVFLFGCFVNPVPYIHT